MPKSTRKRYTARSRPYYYRRGGGRAGVSRAFRATLNQIKLYGQQRRAGVPSMLGQGYRRIKYTPLIKHKRRGSLGLSGKFKKMKVTGGRNRRTYWPPYMFQIANYGAQKRLGYPSMLGLGYRRIHYGKPN